jgi:hypothetical protein
MVMLTEGYVAADTLLRPLKADPGPCTTPAFRLGPAARVLRILKWSGIVSRARETPSVVDQLATSVPLVPESVHRIDGEYFSALFVGRLQTPGGTGDNRQ